MKKLISTILIVSLMMAALTGCFQQSENTFSVTNSSDNSDDNNETGSEDQVDYIYSETKNIEFDEFLDKLARKQLEESPLTATFTIGDLEAHNLLYLASELDHIDLEAYKESVIKVEENLELLKGFSYESLTRDQQLNYELAEFNMESALGSQEFLYIDNLIQPSSGIQVNFPLALMQIEFESVKELDAFVLRVQEVPRLFDETIAYEQERFQLGYGLPGQLYEEVVEQIDKMLGEPDEFMMYLSFVDRIDAMTELGKEEKIVYKETYLRIIEEELFPAFERLRDQAKLMTSSQNGGSISEWPDGKDYYYDLVKYKTSGEMGVVGLEQWANQELSEAYGQLASIIQSYPELLEGDFYAMFPSYDSMDEVYDLVDLVYEDQFMDYGTKLASENVIPSYLEEHLAAGFYFPVTTDGEDYGNMFLQATDYEEVTMDTVSLFYHENIPGHHLYYSYIADSDDPLYRKMNEYLPYEEGWATYIQNAIYDYVELPQGLYELMEANNRATNAFRVLLDIKFHYHGMTMEEASNEMLEFGFAEEAITSVLNRMVSKPGEMIHYMYGEYKMRYYKELFIELSGDDYNVKDFHDFILMHYGLPFYLVEEELYRQFSY